MTAIDPGISADRDHFLDDVEKLLDHVKNSPRLADVTQIMLPGETGDALTKKAQDTGKIDIANQMWQQLRSKAEKINL